MQAPTQSLEVRLMKQTKNIQVPLAALFTAISVHAAPDLARGAEPPQSPWVEGFNNKARLIAGRATGGPHGAMPLIYAGVEIAMPTGWKTYWRNPGEAGGIPPEFDVAGSENLESATVLYPAPHRLTDKAGTNIGYKDSVTFPILILPKDQNKPVVLKLKATYGVCKDICVPAEAELGLEIPADIAASPELADVLATVPMSAPNPSAAVMPGKDKSAPNPENDPTLQRWRIDGAKLVLDVKDPGGGDGDAFLYSPDGLYLPMTKKTSEGNGQVVFEADLSDGNKPDDLKGKSISVTLAGRKGQTETFIQLP